MGVCECVRVCERGSDKRRKFQTGNAHYMQRAQALNTLTARNEISIRIVVLMPDIIREMG